MFSKGDQLVGNRSTYIIKEFLGEGLTARVYRATADKLDVNEVALKVLKPGLSDDVVSQFHTEAGHLSELMAAFRDVEGGSLGPASPPSYYEVFPHKDGTEPEYTYMVLEVMGGRQVEWLLAEEGQFDERKGLIAGVQLLGLFKILHDQLGRVYTDFKFENLWWEKQERVRVTDWNVLAQLDEKKKNHLQDLERCTRALVRILTGSPLPVGRRLSEQPGWDSLSPAIRRSLTRMLHPNPQRRFNSAREIHGKLTQLLSYWQQEPAQLLKQAEGRIERSIEKGNINSKDIVGQALDLLDLFEWRMVGRVGQPALLDANSERKLNELRRRLDNHHPHPEQAVSNGMNLLRGGSIGSARDELNRALLASPDYIAAYRGLAVVTAISTGSLRGDSEHRLQLCGVVDACNRGDYRSAEQKLKKMNAVALLEFELDIQIHTAWERASTPKKADDAQINDDEMKSSIQYRLDALDGAEDALGELASINSFYADAVRADLGIDIEDFRESVNWDKAHIFRDDWSEELVCALNQCILDRNLAGGLGLVQRKLGEITPDERALLKVLELGDEFLRSKSFEPAMKTFSLGMRPEYGMPETFRARWRIAYGRLLIGKTPIDERHSEELERVIGAVQIRKDELELQKGDEKAKEESAVLSKQLTPLNMEWESIIREEEERALQQASDEKNKDLRQLKAWWADPIQQVRNHMYRSEFEDAYEILETKLRERQATEEVYTLIRTVGQRCLADRDYGLAGMVFSLMRDSENDEKFGIHQQIALAAKQLVEFPDSEETKIEVRRVTRIVLDRIEVLRTSPDDWKAHGEAAELDGLLVKHLVYSAEKIKEEEIRELFEQGWGRPHTQQILKEELAKRLSLAEFLELHKEIGGSVSMGRRNETGEGWVKELFETSQTIEELRMKLCEDKTKSPTTLFWLCSWLDRYKKYEMFVNKHKGQPQLIERVRKEAGQLIDQLERDLTYPPFQPYATLERSPVKTLIEDLRSLVDSISV